MLVHGDSVTLIEVKSMQEIEWKLIKVLVVEDDVTTCKILEKHLEKIGCTFVIVNDGQQAIDIIEKYHFDVCFMDLMMPVMGGIEATRIIRKDIDCDMPIVTLTVSPMKANKNKCLELGMDDYIQKPADIEILRKFILEYGLRKDVKNFDKALV